MPEPRTTKTHGIPTSVKNTPDPSFPSSLHGTSSNARQYTKRFMAFADIKPGDRVLDLCCGTGLDAFMAAEMVGSEGEMVGVDISEEMLSVSRRKQAEDKKLGPRCRFFRHDVTKLESLLELKPESFDWIICSNAFVLFDNPAEVVASWRNFLGAGGKLLVDIIHEHNLRSGMVMERVASRMGLKFPFKRAWIKSADSFREILESARFVVEKCELLEKVAGVRSTYYGIEDADAQFEYITGTALTLGFATEDIKENSRSIFREEWEKAAVDGKIEVVDALYVYIARKA
jgi:ubiquinone/menaquinone biosynthesis C-methylase UbiE